MSDTPSQAASANQSGENGQQRGRSFAERVTLGTSVAIIAAIVVVISVLYLHGGEEPPRIVTAPQLEQLRHDESGFYLPVTVTNTGDHTIENLVVQAELDIGDGDPQTAEFSLNFIDGGETLRGTFVFAEDPTSGDLSIGAVSYTEP